ncbi:hypothetical protein ACAH01_06960 [Halomicrobium sp. HM KBTZ05]|uniref:hypothetical protein n=1 Tax=Halomicrobium sp. HM KBTZ05 TaxID=3242663 RepID=UPI003558CE0D
MRRTVTRRRALGTTGTILAALAGCSTLSTGTRYDEERLRDIAEEAIPDPSIQFPFTTPSSMIAFHRDRARAFLEQVPESVSLPNAATARSIENERSALADRVDSESREADDSDGESDEDSRRTPRERLFDWRRNRVEAARLLGRYRAATGDIERSALRERRDAIRSDRADFVAAHEYRSTDPTSAVHQHLVLESMLRTVTRELEPYPPFPEAPTADPDEVGYLVGKMVRAEATLSDARRYRDQLPDDGDSYRPAMMATATWLRRRARRTETALERYLEQGVSALDGDVSGTPRESWFRVAREIARDHSNSELLDAIGESSYAGAVLEAGRRRTALSTLETVVDEIEGGTYGGRLSMAQLASLRERAVSNVQSTLQKQDRFGRRLVEPAVDRIRDGSQRLGSGASPESVNRAAGRFAYAEYQAPQASAVADEVRNLLTSAGE